MLCLPATRLGALRLGATTLVRGNTSTIERRFKNASVIMEHSALANPEVMHAEHFMTRALSEVDFDVAALGALSPIRVGAWPAGADNSAGVRVTLAASSACHGAFLMLHLLGDLHDHAWPIYHDAASHSRGDEADWTVCTATDGNHGRSVAWGAQMIGCQAVIYIHAEVSAGRQQAMEGFGAEVRRIAGNYDDSVRIAAETAAEADWVVVSDTSWPGYAAIPTDVMHGCLLYTSPSPRD